MPQRVGPRRADGAQQSEACKLIVLAVASDGQLVPFQARHVKKRASGTFQVRVSRIRRMVEFRQSDGWLPVNKCCRAWPFLGSALLAPAYITNESLVYVTAAGVVQFVSAEVIPYSAVNRRFLRKKKLQADGRSVASIRFNRCAWVETRCVNCC